MFELRILGCTPQELMSNLNSVAYALAGTPQSAAKPVAPAEKEDIFPESDKVGEAVAGPNPSVSDAPKTRGRKPKPAPQTIDVSPTPPAEPLQTADFLDDAPATEKTYTEADCREAVRQTLDNFETRTRAADPKLAELKGAALKEAEEQLMNAKVAYTKKLLAKFKLAKVSDLKPAQYAAFMAEAQGYVEGTA